jgi:phage baseplate assembly protein W
MSVIASQLINRTIDTPFAFVNGRVNTILQTDPKVWKNRLLALLSTNTNERVWYYDYGVSLNNVLFEPSQTAVEDAKYAIQQMFSSWLPTLTLVNIVSNFDPGAGVLNLTITYTLPSGDQDSVKISTENLSPAGDTTEVIA